MVKIVVTQNLDLYPDQAERLKSLGDVKFYDNLPKFVDEWLKRIEDADIICTGKFGFRDKINEIKNKFVSLPFVGVGAVNPGKIKENGTFVS
ncbi:hypothetical protein N9934_04850, partial [Desulfosarcina sp.]|nr:hypothetical protein [Desulfosarcina sp.]